MLAAIEVGTGGGGTQLPETCALQEPWEATDGAVHLAAELSELDPAGTEARLSLLSRLAGIDSFIHAYALRETIFKALPRVARAVGKRAFKPHLEELLTPLFRSLSCGHQLAEHAAGMCLGAIRDMIGPNILAGRLDDEQLRLLNTSPLIPPSSFGAPAGTGQGIGGAQGPGMLRVQ